MKRTVTFILTMLCAAAFLLNIGAHAPYNTELTEESREIIARAVECTAPGASYVARLGIAALIVNRINDPRFADDARSVIYEYDAFECTRMSDFETTEISPLSDIAARDALLGFDCTCGAVYFRRGMPSESAGCCFYHSGILFYK